MDPVRTKNVREIMAMYAKYRTVGTNPAMFNLDTKYHIEYRNRYNPEDLMKAQAI
jgi:hypothetical protein